MYMLQQPTHVRRPSSGHTRGAHARVQLLRFLVEDDQVRELLLGGPLADFLEFEHACRCHALDVKPQTHRCEHGGLIVVAPRL